MTPPLLILASSTTKERHDDSRDAPFVGPVGVCDLNAFALQGGAGVDFRTGSPDMRVRLQFDLRRVFASVGFTSERLSAGVVLPLNK